MEIIENEHISFEGSLLEQTYSPKFLPSPDTIKKEIKGASASTSSGYKIKRKYHSVGFRPYKPYNDFIDVILAGVVEVACEVFIEVIKFRLYTSKTELRKARSKYNSLVNDVNKDFEDYKSDHESYLQKISDDVEVINRKKTLMKDYLLDELYKKLQKMGVESTFKDLKMERLDLRMFPINENYDIIKKNHFEFEEINKSTSSSFLELINVPKNGFFYGKRIKNINEKCKELDRLSRLNEEQILTDLVSLDILETALKNVACIYSDIMETLRPIMEELLRDLSYKYDDDFSKMPHEKLEAIKKLKTIFKDLSETVIVPCESPKDLTEKIVKFNNNLSSKYNDLKEEILRMAI